MILIIVFSFALWQINNYFIADFEMKQKYYGRIIPVAVANESEIIHARLLCSTVSHSQMES